MAGSDGAAATPADVLVVGERGAGRRTLLSALQAMPCSPSAAAYSLILDTKYYSAHLRVCMSGLSASRSAAAAGDDPAAQPQLQALVLVFDASSRAAWQALQAWCQQQQATGQLEDVEVRLVVANQLDRLAGAAGAAAAAPSPVDGPPAAAAGSAAAAHHRDSSSQQQPQEPQLPPWLEQARAWCYANGYEFIAAAAGAPAVDAQLTEDGEQQGVARVLAALQAHMWPSMVPKKQQQKQQQQQATGGPAPAVAASGVRDQGLPLSPDEAATQQQQPGDRDAVKATDSTTSSSSSRQSSKPAQQPAAAGPDDEDGDPFLPSAGLDDFEALMRQVRGARTRLSGLPDNARRAAAAELALKLSSMMGLDDGSTSEEDSGDDDGEAARDGGAAAKQQRVRAVR